MSETPMQVVARPFAVEPVTNIMLPDGIFDNAIYNLRIACHYTNLSSSPLTDVSIYLESVGDPGVSATAQTFQFAAIPAGASVLVMWDANFKNASPGKRLVGFVASANGFKPRRSIQQIFISQTRYDDATHSYTCTVEEGTLKISNIAAIGPRSEWGGRDGKEGRECHCPSDGPWVPTGMTLVWEPNPAYAGAHGDLPFADPWWKILALVVAIIAALVSVIAKATGGSGSASIAASGTFDDTEPNVHCCSFSASGSVGLANNTVAGVAGAIAGAALAVAMSDAADPFWRGQNATPPGSGELTIGENVTAKWSLTEAPNAGRAYPVDVAWTYTRITGAQTYEYSVKEIQTNTHISDGVEIETPATVHPFNALWIRAKFHRKGDDLYKGSQLYAFCLFRAPEGLYFLVPLEDNGLGFDPGANDGIFAGALDLKVAYRRLLANKEDMYGIWRIYVFAQDVNQTKPGTPPEIAAQHIGGFVVASAITITFDPSLPCPLTAQGAIAVA